MKARTNLKAGRMPLLNPFTGAPMGGGPPLLDPFTGAPMQD